MLFNENKNKHKKYHSFILFFDRCNQKNTNEWKEEKKGESLEIT